MDRIYTYNPLYFYLGNPLRVCDFVEEKEM